MTATLVDFSYARPDLAQLKASGVGGILVYTSAFGDMGPTVRAALALGLTVNAIMEGPPQPALSDFPGGVARSQRANADVQGWNVGYNGAIYYVAEDPSRLGLAEWPIVERNFQGINTVPGVPVGAYGGLQLVTHLMNMGLAKYGWVVDNWGGTTSQVHISQELNLPINLAAWTNQVDYDRVLQDDYGQMPRPFTPPPPPPIPPPVRKRNQDMLLVHFTPDGSVWSINGETRRYIKTGTIETSTLAALGQPKLAEWDDKNLLDSYTLVGGGPPGD